FIAGYPTFTTLIALVKDGVPVLSVVNQPVNGERWLGMAGKASTLNGKPVATRIGIALKDAVIATTSVPYYFNAMQGEAFETLRKRCAQTVVGGDGYGYAMLASGQIDLFVDAG